MTGRRSKFCHPLVSDEWSFEEGEKGGEGLRTFVWSTEIMD